MVSSIQLIPSNGTNSFVSADRGQAQVPLHEGVCPPGNVVGDEGFVSSIIRVLACSCVS